MKTFKKYLFRSLYTKNSTSFDLSNFFIQAAGFVYHHDAVVDIISPYGAVSHHALACILQRLDDIQRQAVGDIQGIRLDDIHAVGVISRLSSKPY